MISKSYNFIASNESIFKIMYNHIYSHHSTYISTIMHRLSFSQLLSFEKIHIKKKKKKEENYK